MVADLSFYIGCAKVHGGVDAVHQDFERVLVYEVLGGGDDIQCVPGKVKHAVKRIRCGQGGVIPGSGILQAFHCLWVDCRLIALCQRNGRGAGK